MEHHHTQQRGKEYSGQIQDPVDPHRHLFHGQKAADPGHKDNEGLEGHSPHHGRGYVPGIDLGKTFPPSQKTDECRQKEGKKGIEKKHLQHGAFLHRFFLCDLTGTL